MKLSCKETPVRIWIIVLSFTIRFLMMSISQTMKFCWRHMLEVTHQVRYRPWCLLSTRQRLVAAQIPWYNDTASRHGRKDKWSEEHFRYIKDAHFYGQMISPIPGGILAEYIGPFYLLFYTTAMVAILNIGRTMFTVVHWKKLVAVEFVLGFHIGLVYPALYTWAARWAPPNERGVFLASQAGNGFGKSLTRVFVRYMIMVVGWQWIFYISTVLTALHLIPLWYFGSNNPEHHKRISAEELLYIKRSQRGRVTSTRSFPPFGNILSSGAFWSLNILSFGAHCSQLYFLDVVANFLYNFIGIPRGVVEVIEVFPHIAFSAIAVTAGLAGDYVRTKTIMGDTTMIKTNIVFSHLGPGCLLLLMGITYCKQNAAIVLLFIGYASCGCSVISCYRTIIDISPNYAGTIYGLLHTSGSLVNIIVPKLSKLIFTFSSGRVGWTIIFLIGGGCLIGTGVIFLFFGTASTQWWNLKSQDIFKLYHYKKPEQRPPQEGEDNFAGASGIQNQQQANDFLDKGIDIDSEDWKSSNGKTLSNRKQ